MASRKLRFDKEQLQVDTKRIIFERKKKGWTQSKLAEKSDLSKRTIENIENEKTRPSPESRKRISRALGLEPEDLLVQSGEASEQAPLLSYCAWLLRSSARVRLGNLSVGDPFMRGSVELDGVYVPLHVRGKSSNGRESVVDALAREKHLLLRAHPGRGKTTLVNRLTTYSLLSWIANELGASFASSMVDELAEWFEKVDLHVTKEKLTAIAEGETNHHAEGMPLLPIVIRCRDLNADASCLNGSLEDWLRKTIKKAELGVTRNERIDETESLLGLLQTRLREGKAILLIDGLDEISDPSCLIQFCRQLDTVREAFEKAPILVTSRFNALRELAQSICDDFHRVELAEFSKADKEEFIEKWFSNNQSLGTESEHQEAQRNAAELIEEINQNHRVRDLSGSPMLLTLIAMIKRSSSKIPNGRYYIYTSVLRLFLRWGDSVAPIDEEEAFPQLEYLAYTMCKRGTTRFSRKEIIDCFDQVRHDWPEIDELNKRQPREFLSLLLKRGILSETTEMNEQGESRVAYELLDHQLYQEYLAARALVECHYPGFDKTQGTRLADHIQRLSSGVVVVNDESWPGKKRARVEDWREILRLCVTGCRDSEVREILLGIVEPIDGEESDITSRPRAVAAAYCLSDEPNADSELVSVIAKQFASQINDLDGEGIISTSVDSAAELLASSRFDKVFREALIAEFTMRADHSRHSAGSICAMMLDKKRKRQGIDDAELVKRLATQLRSTQPQERIESALLVMYLAYFWKCRSGFKASAAETLIDGLLDMLPAGAAEQDAAAWSLFWFRGADFNESHWIPNDGELQKLHRALNGRPVSSKVSSYSRVRTCLEIIIDRCESLTLDDSIALLSEDDARRRRLGVESIARICLATDVANRADLIQRVRDLLMDSVDHVRRATVGSLAKIEGLDKRSQQCLSMDLDGRWQWIDPRFAVDEYRLEKTCSKLKINRTLAAELYSKLEVPFSLTLRFDHRDD